jgi:hypothetical protein
MVVATNVVFMLKHMKCKPERGGHGGVHLLLWLKFNEKNPKG